MRIGDLLNLKIDCISPLLVSEYTITWFDHKNRKYHNHMPVRTKCVEVVKLLIKTTNELRKECDDGISDLMFIHKPITSCKADQVSLIVICRLIDRKMDKEVYDFQNSEEEASFNDMRKVKGKLNCLDSLYRILRFTKNIFLILSVLAIIISL